MTAMKKITGLGIAAVAAASFALVSTSASAATHHKESSKNVKCYGVNKCSGKGNGKNDCQGKGMYPFPRKPVINLAALHNQQKMAKKMAKMAKMVKTVEVLLIQVQPLFPPQKLPMKVINKLE